MKLGTVSGLSHKSAGKHDLGARSGHIMSRYWSDVVNTLTPYVPGEQPLFDKLVKLNTNESPYPPSPRVMEAISAVSADALAAVP